jgi:acetyltransferase-like isoleucine patch superfamily enzyme
MKEVPHLLRPAPEIPGWLPAGISPTSEVGRFSESHVHILRSMPYYPLRTVALPDDTQAAYDEWLHAVDRELEREDCDRNELCRKILTDIYYPDLPSRDPEALAPSTRIALLQMDPRNVTLEPEYYHEIDEERYYRVKPLIWLWEMFDKSPLGENVHLGVRFRRILARRIFKRCGRNFKAFHFVKLSFGYNLEVGDDVVVHRHVLLDDRGGIRIGNRASVSDFANVYSHTHDIVDPKIVETPATILGDGVRITYHATILAGVHVTDDSMVGAMAMATRDTKPSTVHVGIPAKPVKEKPGDRTRKPGPPDPLATE